jgi:hypothetical protein
MTNPDEVEGGSPVSAPVRLDRAILGLLASMWESEAGDYEAAGGNEGQARVLRMCADQLQAAAGFGALPDVWAELDDTHLSRLLAAAVGKAGGLVTVTLADYRDAGELSVIRTGSTVELRAQP